MRQELSDTKFEEWMSQNSIVEQYRGRWGYPRIDQPARPARAASAAVVLLCAGAMAAVYLAAFLLN